MPQVRSRVRDVTALLLSALTAAAGAALFYGVKSGAIVRRVAMAPAAGDRFVLIAYCVALLVALALVTSAVAAALATVSATAGRVLGALLSGLLLAAVYFDDRLHALEGLHLYDWAVTRLVGVSGANEAVHFSLGETAFVLATAAAACGAMFAVTIVWSRALERRAAARPGALLAAVVACVLVVDVAAFVAARRALASDTSLATALPLHSVLFEAGRRAEPLAIHYPKLPPGAHPTLQRRPNIVVVLVETLRSDMLVPEYMPALSRFAEAQGCDRSERHYSASHVTDFSFFSLVYGLHAYHYLPFAQQKVPSFPLRVLKESGYAVVGAASAPLAAWGDLADVTRQFDTFASFDGKGPAERDQQLADWAARWRREHGAERPYFMLLFFDATHHKYYYPPAYERFRPSLPESHNLVTGKVQDPEVRRAFINRYRNSVRYVDHLVAELATGFAAAARDDLVFVVTGDHGEEFWDNGLLGHTAVSFVNARIEVPLLVCTPERDARRFARSSEVDLMPTLLDYARPSPPLPAAAYSNGAPLLGAADADRFLLVSGMGFPFTNRQVCLISATRKYWLEKERTGAKRFVLQRSTDLDDRDAPPIADELARGIAELERTYRTFFSP